MRAARGFCIALALTMGAGSLAAQQVSSYFEEWSKGPVHWLMTNGERSAWSDVHSDAEARQFIDLFWARRDPTPGTPRNEYREAIHERIVAADEQFSTRRMRGSLTDFGRVYIVLGPPDSTLRQPERWLGGASQSLTTARDVGTTIQFVYHEPAALGLNGRVYFIENVSNHQYHFDTQRGNVAGALAIGARNAIVNPELSTVPSWAATDPH